jgi:hypothetical protein
VSHPPYDHNSDDDLERYRRLAEKSRLLGLAWRAAPRPFRIVGYLVLLFPVEAIARATGLPVSLSDATRFLLDVVGRVH